MAGSSLQKDDAMTPEERSVHVQRLAPAMLLASMRDDDESAGDMEFILEDMLGRALKLDESLSVEEGGALLLDIGVVFGAFTRITAAMFEWVCAQVDVDAAVMLEAAAAAMADQGTAEPESGLA
jgi:hypothetical protein